METRLADPWHRDGVVLKDREQRVLEADPPRRLSYTWNKMTREFAATFGLDLDFVAHMQEEARSKVTFELEPVGDAVKRPHARKH